MVDLDDRLLNWSVIRILPGLLKPWACAPAIGARLASPPRMQTIKGLMRMMLPLSD